MEMRLLDGDEAPKGVRRASPYGFHLVGPVAEQAQLRRLAADRPAAFRLDPDQPNHSCAT